MRAGEVTLLQSAICKMVDASRCISRADIDAEFKRQIDELESEGDLIPTPKGGYLRVSDETRPWINFIDSEDD